VTRIRRIVVVAAVLAIVSVSLTVAAQQRPYRLSDQQGPTGSGQGAQQMAAFVAQMTLMKDGREHELESDTLGVQIVADAGYDPRALVNVMDILACASGGGRQPEFFSTHPDPGNRQEHIRQAITAKFPQGVPAQLTPGLRITLR